ncbi:MAG: hypothetical protein AKCLJLPJ_02176 [Fimbriimonadales bacterium]|nr:MAG: type II secretion system protein [Armatimonadota bacterium]MBV6504079.1 hypothetical protein [Fimbriimonadales bacterium]MCE7900070.1 type II secretion system protein [Armatimonadetes bacterium ATM1]MDL1929084.1 type II secretion system protein [Fimbriimonadia bacterium ATM]MBC6968941.1 type II secretion system protein [Armatimonadota bacterium]
MNRRNVGFTLIELLVVIAIIAILSAILFPVMVNAKNAAKRSANLTNGRQIGMALMMYLSDYDDTFPIFYDYNSQPPAGQVGHKGVEVQLAPYCASAQRGDTSVALNRLFYNPFDTGGPFTWQDVPGSTSYWDAYGSSYHFTKCMFSVIANESSRNNQLYNYTKVVTTSAIVDPAGTRVIRDEMMAFFDDEVTEDACARYGYDCPPPWNFFQKWDPIGGMMVFADGHAKHIPGSAYFDDALIDPAGHRTGDPHPTDGTWYWACD